ncbi:hypothetical protein HMPREF0372_03622 [Flavonifractor plautii ATCC 29863]|uniref:Uncharacterized protein n=1 Tax=Flavonifractor plautii ATCC 29863 TaxID=411475 RepID=G9YVQ7_FLAPL|nr:hypothetical protein HMPREF0372_03622 [Flavonifractor plautii ATCC 29863]
MKSKCSVHRTVFILPHLLLSFKKCSLFWTWKSRPGQAIMLHRPIFCAHF